MSEDKPPLVSAEAVPAGAPDRFAYLGENRRLVVKRSLLATALGGLVPLPVADDYVASLVRADMLRQIARRRNVDLDRSSSELLADPHEGTTVRNATITAAALLAFKLAWRKFFAVLALSRRAEEMAVTFQAGTLFDHYCARVHVGGAVDRPRAAKLRAVIHDTVDAAHKDALRAAFRDGASVLGRSLLEAPAWAARWLSRLGERFVRSGGNPDLPVDLGPEAPGGGRWVDRAADTVETRLGGLGAQYLGGLVGDFDRRWRAIEEAEAAIRAAEQAAAGTGGPAGPGGPVD